MVLVVVLVLVLVFLCCLLWCLLWLWLWAVAQWGSGAVGQLLLNTYPV